MSVEIFDKSFDRVVKSVYCIGKTTYEYAITNIYPQIDKYYAQRKKVDEMFYNKLERDIPNGCIMPPITIALITEGIEEINTNDKSEIAKIIDQNKGGLYILDGIQRLNTLKRAYSDAIKDYTLYFNILISDNDDRLLYRMITLNNGQKPMSARHQIEVLAYNIFDFENVVLPVQTEKERSKKIIKGSFNKDDIIKGYISYLSGSVNIDNQKIIESKMDELIAEKIIESDVTHGDIEFINVIELIERFVDNPYLHQWFKQSNNLIGFSAGISKSYSIINADGVGTFKERIETFEKAFESFDISKIKLGHLRRLCVHHFIDKYAMLKDSSVSELTENLSQASIIFM